MRKTVLAATVALLTTLWLTGAASAVDLPSHRSPDARPPGDAAARFALRSDGRFLTLGAKLAGSAVVSGHAYGYYGTGMQDVYVYGDAPDGSTWAWDETYTDAAGAYSLSGLTAASSNGSLFASYPTDPWYGMWRDYATWTDPGPTGFDWRPGVVSTTVARGGVWTGWDYARTYLYGYDALSNVTGGSDIVGTNDVVYGDAYAPAGTYAIGATYFWMDQGYEFPTSATITAGAVSATSVSVDQANAQRIYVTTPYWGSGKPGTVAAVKGWNYPAGWNLDYYGYADSPSGTPYKEYTDVVTTGADPFTKSVTIPSTAPAGYWYIVGAYNASGVLDLETPFQVCTLKSSKTAVRRGGAIKLSGVVPTQGHWGSTPGKTKYVTIYKRTKSVSSAPKVWNATAKGWTKVATVKASGLGKYASAYLKPSRTTWYVVRYPGDDWYWGAYTSVLKVRVY